MALNQHSIVETPRGLINQMKRHAHGSCTLAKQSNLIGITTKICNILLKKESTSDLSWTQKNQQAHLHPLHRKTLVQNAIISVAVLINEPAEYAQSIVKRDQDCVGLVD